MQNAILRIMAMAPKYSSEINLRKHTNVTMSIYIHTYTHTHTHTNHILIMAMLVEVGVVTRLGLDNRRTGVQFSAG